MMKVDRFLFGVREHFSKADIVSKIVSSKNYQRELEEGDRPSSLLLFETSKQHTWLVATRRRLYCILDDVRNSEPKVNWSMARSALVENGTLKIDLKSRDKSSTAGMVDIGHKHPNWLFSKKFFTDKKVAEEIRDLVIGKMS